MPVFAVCKHFVNINVLFLHPCESVDAADQRERVIFHAEGVRAVTD